ncbi:MAG: T9SS type A sorting domain-containing protein [Bacteroidia bacterium]
MKIQLFVSALLFSAAQLQAQVPRKVVVEHFSNTLCSVCASRNPGFYTNYSNQPNTIHLSVHPSSPYSGCVLSQHNVAGNDGRTNYYGIYGSTPRLVIQGDVIAPSANYSASALFASYTGQTSPASIRIEQTKFANDSIRASVIIKTEATHNLGSLQLYVALAEDTVFYNAPNGENEHYDVFRKAFTGVTGLAVTLPANVGDSVVYTFSSPANLVWNFARINTFVILQETTSQAVVQAQSYPSQIANAPTSLPEMNTEFGSIYSNGTELAVQQNVFAPNRVLTVFDITGRAVYTQQLNSAIEYVVLPETSGLYLYAVTENNKLLARGKVVRN